MLTCVVNVSEGRRGPTLDAIAAAAEDELLDLHADPHHHRSVLTLVGERAPRLVAGAALARLDLRRHTGAHPRLGAVDVVPFVAVDADDDEGTADTAADRFATWLAGDLGVPAFRYGRAHPSLPAIRRDAFATVHPWAGPGLPHPTAGATAVGSRAVLVAYNIWLRSPDLARARAVARQVRGPRLRALGVRVGDRVQVSMNLVDPLALGPADAHDAIADLVDVDGAELVGLVPEAVLRAVPADRWQQLDLAPDRTIEARLAVRSRRSEQLAPRR